MLNTVHSSTKQHIKYKFFKTSWILTEIATIEIKNVIRTVAIVIIRIRIAGTGTITIIIIIRIIKLIWNGSW